jgi:hypothetical protein
MAGELFYMSGGMAVLLVFYATSRLTYHKEYEKLLEKRRKRKGWLYF